MNTKFKTLSIEDIEQLTAILVSYQRDIDFKINALQAIIDFDNNVERTCLPIKHDAYCFFDHYTFVSV